MARPRKVKSEPEVQEAVVEQTTMTNSLAPDVILENAKGRFDNLIVVGILPDGNLDVTTTNPNYVFLQYALNKASFELLFHEKTARQSV